MTSQKQIKANRQNAQRSTGPKTLEPTKQEESLRLSAFAFQPHGNIL